MATKQALLDEARAAYHSLMTGTAVVKLRDQNGEQIEYNQASVLRLASYISALENEIAGWPAANGPMRVWF